MIRRRIKIRPKNSGPWLVMPIDELPLLLNEECPDEEYDIKVVMISDEEIEKLCEFGGW